MSNEESKNEEFDEFEQDLADTFGTLDEPVEEPEEDIALPGMEGTAAIPPEPEPKKTVKMETAQLRDLDRRLPTNMAVEIWHRDENSQSAFLNTFRYEDVRSFGPIQEFIRQRVVEQYGKEGRFEIYLRLPQGKRSYRGPVLVYGLKDKTPAGSADPTAGLFQQFTNALNDMRQERSKSGTDFGDVVKLAALFKGDGGGEKQSPMEMMMAMKMMDKMDAKDNQNRLMDEVGSILRKLGERMDKLEQRQSMPPAAFPGGDPLAGIVDAIPAQPPGPSLKEIMEIVKMMKGDGSDKEQMLLMAEKLHQANADAWKERSQFLQDTLTRVEARNDRLMEKAERGGGTGDLRTLTEQMREAREFAAQFAPADDGGIAGFLNNLLDNAPHLVQMMKEIQVGGGLERRQIGPESSSDEVEKRTVGEVMEELPKMSDEKVVETIDDMIESLGKDANYATYVQQAVTDDAESTKQNVLRLLDVVFSKFVSENSLTAADKDRILSVVNQRGLKVWRDLEH